MTQGGRRSRPPFFGSPTETRQAGKAFPKFKKLQDYLAAKADAKGIGLTDLVSEMLKKDIELIEMGR
jgi:hypothetical protein